jgi:hypothetical protein
MKRVAIVYSGRPRNIVETFENHSRIFSLDSDCRAVFSFLWFDETLAGRYFREEHPYQGRWPGPEIRDWVAQHWRRGSARFALPHDFSRRASEFQYRWPRFHPIENTISEIYAFSNALKLVGDYELSNRITFDLVVRARTDLLINDLHCSLDDYNPDWIHIAPGGYSEREYGNGFGCVGDHPLLIIMGSDVAKQLSRFYDDLSKLATIGIPTYHPENLWSHYLRRIVGNKINYQLWDIRLFCGSNATLKPAWTLSHY